MLTARSWNEVPAFIIEKLGFVLEFRLDDPARSLMDDGMAAAVPDRPGFCLAYCLGFPGRLHAQIVLP